jgi:ABC-type amino acid transport substrate-binding protein
MRIPADFFQLFVPVDTLTGRFGTLLAAVHTIVRALLTAVAARGALRWRWAALARYIGVSAVLAVTLFAGLRLFFEYAVPQAYRGHERLAQMDLAINRAAMKLLNPEQLAPSSFEGARERFAAIRTRGTLRVGYPSDRLPWVFSNAEGRLVGIDVDLAHLLGADLGVGLDFVNVEPAEVARYLDDGRVDIAIGGLAVTPERALSMRFTEPYMDVTLAFVVRDHARRRFATLQSLRSAGDLRVAASDVPHYNNLVRSALPNVQLISIRSPTEFFEAPEGQFDAMLSSAEGGSAWTLAFPQFGVVVPRPNVVTGPIAFATPKHAPELHDYISTWVALKRRDGVAQHLYDFWILGRGAQSTAPRWSIIRDAPGWID